MKKNEPELLSKKNTAEIIRQYSKYVSSPKVKFFKKIGFEIVMSGRKGINFFDSKSRKYINCHCNGGVFNLGHRNQEIIDSIKKGIELFDIGNHHLISSPKAILAKKIVQSMQHGKKQSEQIQKVIFGVSGGEAVDLALKIAQGYSKRKGIVSIDGGYHGHTGLAVKTGDRKFLDPFSLDKESFFQVPFGKIEELKNALQKKPAVLILETIPATLGMPIFSKEYMETARSLCDKYKVVLILDEVQTGLGRTGKPWGFQHYSITPDIVVTGKGLSGGIYPISATCFRSKYEDVFKKDPFIHISTFGGSELGCYAALKVLEILDDKNFLNHINQLSEFFKIELRKLQEEFPKLQEVRQIGLFMGLVFSDPATCLLLIKILLKNGVFVVYSANDKKVMQFLPPLITSMKEAEEIIQILKNSLIESNSIKNKITKTALSYFF